MSENKPLSERSDSPFFREGAPPPDLIDDLPHSTSLDAKPEPSDMDGRDMLRNTQDHTEVCACLAALALGTSRTTLRQMRRAAADRQGDPVWAQAVVVLDAELRYRS